ncbi:hypothetical protein A1013_RS02270 [Acinetobacter baumannii]|uniref:hypothetical protein n=1 Tax=Acinetobacter baumannii TaxID=470 RepID=UPI00028EFA16|nr:hypothetical protein [Acinetobacter baumannii]EHU1293729.1 hypothetical protein [Acinetobacter baumannii]EHU1349327.1 hypothetical protein [Acinetobacter baumannii]EHU1493245.1 hypothetical protein [Acinetobacter baumannii]EHU1496993.1 hypothetical protein [Acinetobacter baumannii]EHU1532799.1 hypothetical protein [Acinetobacter baumannii]
MKPGQFIREFGEKKAREVVEVAIDGSTHVIYEQADGLINLKELKRLVESLDLIEELGGMKVIKKHLRGGGVLGGRVVIAVKDHESIYGEE